MDIHRGLGAEKLSSILLDWILFVVVGLSLTFSVILVVILLFCKYFVSVCYMEIEKFYNAKKFNKWIITIGYSK